MILGPGNQERGTGSIASETLHSPEFAQRLSQIRDLLKPILVEFAALSHAAQFFVAADLDTIRTAFSTFKKALFTLDEKPNDYGALRAAVKAFSAAVQDKTIIKNYPRHQELLKQIKELSKPPVQFQPDDRSYHEYLLDLRQAGRTVVEPVRPEAAEQTGPTRKNVVQFQKIFKDYLEAFSGSTSLKRQKDPRGSLAQLLERGTRLFEQIGTCYRNQANTDRLYEGIQSFVLAVMAANESIPSGNKTKPRLEIEVWNSYLELLQPTLKGG